MSHNLFSISWFHNLLTSSLFLLICCRQMQAAVLKSVMWFRSCDENLRMYFGILDWNLWFCDLKCSPQSCSSNFVSATLYGGRDDVWWRNGLSSCLVKYYIKSSSSPVFWWWCSIFLVLLLRRRGVSVVEASMMMF